MLDPSITVISEYGDSAIINALIQSANVWIDPEQSIDTFYQDVVNILTAEGPGLDIWGRILGFSRIIQVPTGEYFGFEQQAGTGIDTFGFASFYSGQGSTGAAILTDTAYRTALLTKAATNISNCSIPAINAILLALFPLSGAAYCTDGGDMTMTYTFTFVLSPLQLALVSTPGLLPRPTGVSATIVSP